MGSWTPPGQLFCRLHLRYTFSRSHWLAELGKLSGSIYRIQHAVKQGQSSGRFIVYSVNFTHLMSSWTEHLPCITSCAEPPACALRKGISWKKTHLTMWIILKPTYDCLEPAWYFRSKLHAMQLCAWQLKGRGNPKPVQMPVSILTVLTILNIHNVNSSNTQM